MIKHLPEGYDSKLAELGHRLSTIQDADLIVVLDKGHIVEMGNHETLLKQKGNYYDLYMTQFAGNSI